MVVPLVVLGCSFVATAEAGVVRVEFAVTVLPAHLCGEQRESALAKSVAEPGSIVTGELEYDPNATMSAEHDPLISDLYYSPPNHLRISVAVGEKKARATATSKGTIWISAALLGRAAPGQPKMGFAETVGVDPNSWSGATDTLGISLVLKAKDYGPRLHGLPTSSELNSMPLSSLSRLSVSGARSSDMKRPGPPLWSVCGELVSLVASDQSSK